MTKARWPMLPGGNWTDAADARHWLLAEKNRLGWDHARLRRAFNSVACQSDLFIGPGGGELFPGAAEGRQRRFEAGGETIPDWVYWVPLAVLYVAVLEARIWNGASDYNWELRNIPQHYRLREDEQGFEGWA